MPMGRPRQARQDGKLSRCRAASPHALNHVFGYRRRAPRGSTVRARTGISRLPMARRGALLRCPNPTVGSRCRYRIRAAEETLQRILAKVATKQTGQVRSGQRRRAGSTNSSLGTESPNCGAIWPLRPTAYSAVQHRHSSPPSSVQSTSLKRFPTMTHRHKRV